MLLRGINRNMHTVFSWENTLFFFCKACYIVFIFEKLLQSYQMAEENVKVVLEDCSGWSCVGLLEGYGLRPVGRARKALRSVM